MTTIRHNFMQYMRTMQVLFMAFMFVQMSLITVIFLLVNEEDSLIEMKQRNLFIILLAVGVVLLMTGVRFFYQQRLKKIHPKKELKDKLSDYRTSLILFFALSEFCALVCFISSFLSQNLLFVFGSIGVLLLSFPVRPSKTKLIKELNLDFNEQNKLEDPSFVAYESNQSFED